MLLLRDVHSLKMTPMYYRYRLKIVLDVIYVWKLIETLYLAQPAEGLQDQNVPLMMMIPLWVMALACIYFGFDTDITLSAARSAAEGLLAGSAGMR